MRTATNAGSNPRILVGIDGRPSSRDALALAALLAEATDARLVLGTVLPGISPLSDSHVRIEAADRDSAEAFARASAVLDELGASDLPVERRAIGAEPVAEGLRDLARSEGADLIVIGATHRGPVGRIVPGTTADGLIAEARCAFAVAPRGYADRRAPELRLIGLAYDGSNEARRAAAVARALAVRAFAPLRAFGVDEELAGGLAPASFGDDGRGSLERDLDQLLDSLPPGIGGQKLLLAGRPAEVLLAQGPYAADLIVFACHGWGRLLRALGGSVTSAVMRAAPWPVIVVPPHGPLTFVRPGGELPVGATRAGRSMPSRELGAAR